MLRARELGLRMDTYNKKKEHTNIEDRYVLSACNIVKNVYIQKGIYFMRNVMI